MQDITNTMTKQVTPKKQVPRPGFLSGRPAASLNMPKFDNPSLTQDINEIMRRQERAEAENNPPPYENSNTEEVLAPSADGETDVKAKKATKW